MVYITGHNHHVAVCGPLRIWAENGRICIEDERDDSYRTCSVKQMLLRLNALNDMVGSSKRMAASHEEYYDEIKKDQDYIDKVSDVCRIAQSQGMPDTADGQKAAKARRPTSVVVPSLPSFDL